MEGEELICFPTKLQVRNRVIERPARAAFGVYCAI